MKAEVKKEEKPVTKPAADTKEVKEEKKVEKAVEKPAAPAKEEKKISKIPPPS